MSEDKMISMEDELEYPIGIEYNNELLYEFSSYEDAVLFLNRHLLNQKVDTILSYFITNIHRRLDNLEDVNNFLEGINGV